MLIKSFLTLILCASVSFAPERPDVGTMPAPLLAKIMSNLDSSDLANLQLTNRKIHSSVTNYIETSLKAIEPGRLGGYSWKQLQAFQKNPRFEPLVDKILADNLNYLNSITIAEVISSGRSVKLNFQPNLDMKININFISDGLQIDDVVALAADEDWALHIKMKDCPMVCVGKEDLASKWSIDENILKRFYQLGFCLKSEIDSDTADDGLKAIKQKMENATVKEIGGLLHKTLDKMEEYLQKVLSYI